MDFNFLWALSAVLVLMGLVGTLLAWALDIVAGLMGAERAGASRWALQWEPSSAS